MDIHIHGKPALDGQWCGTGNFCRPHFIIETFSRRRCKSTKAGYCEISNWELQTLCSLYRYRSSGGDISGGGPI